ncbi:helix-turn-helix domain-containing protein [Geobacillus stearothermophilus]|uniref:helix-turn-helix domain-containing protein n=3 Tax=Bacteria TaxID=2 RepID=UPI0001721A30|nr:helix-turn-helix domain-containing protein [Geobacillus stearothermophilus]ACB45423.1 repBST1 [Shuttle vector pUCG18]ANO45944.1 RepBSTI [synthetic construct]MBH4539723.1 helix-turn-helix domain-containing protein [Staphylococcus aureus]WLW35443.1 replication protein [Vector pGKE74]WLW35446.1 replication protein [Vector pGKE119]WLW35449.1 replication protein [Vector pGKE122]WLW35452.1 replication protein [Vector pGKE123]WLW35455.1 replication protein [Vector pGKE124]WLW35458.1 replicatio
MYIITSEQFTQLKEIERVTDFVYKRRKIKNELMERIADALGRKFRKAQKTTRVIDEIVWLATDRGFSFPGRETLAKKLGVSLPTVDRATRMLKDSGEVVVCYRENPNSNGPKTPVFIFRSHANFERIAAVLNLRDNEADKVENAEKPTESSDLARKTDATISSPVEKHDDINKLIDNTHPLDKIVKYVTIKVNEVQKRHPYGIRYLSAYINKTLDDLMQRAKAKVKAEKARAQQRKQADYQPTATGLIWYDFTADTSASQPTSQRKPAFDSEDMFAPLLQAVARIKGVEV